MTSRITETWPVAGRADLFPITRGSQGHIDNQQAEAVDIAAPMFTYLYAWREARCTNIVTDPNLTACGRQVDFQSLEDPLLTWRYCHLQDVWCELGQVYHHSQVIGTVGQSGVGNYAPTGPHLHWVMWYDGVRIWPESILMPLTIIVTGPEPEPTLEKPSTLLACLDLIWDRLSKVQQGIDNPEAIFGDIWTDDEKMDHIVDWAEQAKQDGIVQIKKLLGVQE